MRGTEMIATSKQWLGVTTGVEAWRLVSRYLKKKEMASRPTSAEDTIERGPHAAAAGLDQREAEIAGRKVDAVEVAGDGPFGREHEGHRRVGELLGGGVVLVTESDAAGERVRGHGIRRLVHHEGP